MPKASVQWQLTDEGQHVLNALPFVYAEVTPNHDTGKFKVTVIGAYTICLQQEFPSLEHAKHYAYIAMIDWASTTYTLLTGDGAQVPC